MLDRRVAAALGIGAVLATTIAGQHWAQAGTPLVASYPLSQVWPTAVRFLRVDRRLTVREKDQEAGYILFDYPEGGRTYQGALEMLATTDSDGRPATKILLSLPDLARHHEIALVDRLAAKLRDELGTPAPPPRRAPAGGDRDKARDKDAKENETKDKQRGAPDGGGIPRAPTVTP